MTADIHGPADSVLPEDFNQRPVIARLADSAQIGLDLLAALEEVPEQGDGLIPGDWDRWRGPGDLNQNAVAAADEPIDLVTEPSVPGHVRGLLERGGLSWRRGGGQGHQQGHPKPTSHRAASIISRNAAAGSDALMIGLPTTRCVAPQRTASAGAAVRD